jgi:putative glutathione S-transferase
MGMLVEGKWEKQTKRDPRIAGGRFVRAEARYRNWVTPDGSPGPSGEGGFKAQPDRYHLYVSLACPWAHRTLIFRKLKKLTDVISVSVVAPHMLDEGWEFNDAWPDHLYGKTRLYEIYLKSDPQCTSRASVPVLWDKSREKIVSNESSEIIRMLNSAFDEFGDASLDFYPEELRTEIDAVNHLVYETVNNGVYRAGFARTQEAYEEAFRALFNTLDELDQSLDEQRFLVGDRLTEADWRLFTTLIRFDAVYYSHFKCNRRRVIDYPNLWAYTRDLYQQPRIAETVAMDQIKRHYYTTHDMINPTRIIPIGPDIDFLAPHGRG